jgi:hypothetical protein
MWFGEPHPFPERGSPSRLSMSGQPSYKRAIVQSMKYLLLSSLSTSGTICSEVFSFFNLHTCIILMTTHLFPENDSAETASAP